MLANDGRIADIHCGRDWRSCDITLPGEAVKDGLNELVLCWPWPRPGQTAIERVADDLAWGRAPEACCCFGEIPAFTASDGRCRSGPSR